MNNLLIVRRKDLAAIASKLPLDDIEWNYFKREFNALETDIIIFIDDELSAYKILKSRFPEFSQGHIGKLSDFKTNFMSIFLETPEMKAVKELSETAKKYNVCILTATQAIIPNAGQLSLMNLEDADSVYVEVLKHREIDPSITHRFAVQKVFKK